MMKRRTFARPEPRTPDVKMPDFDLADMVWGFPLAVSAAHLNIPAIAITTAAFVTQKSIRRNPEMAAKAVDFALAILPVPDGLEGWLPSDTRKRIAAAKKEEYIEGEIVDTDMDRALAAAALDVARRRVADAPNDTKAKARLARLEAQAKAIYPDLVEADEDDDVPAPSPLHPNHDPLFSALEERPHRLLIGHTGAGKTTLIHELATGWADAGQQVIVCDPDSAPGLWPGCKVIGGGEDYEKIGKALEAVKKVYRRRSEERAAGRRTFDPFHLVIDEVDGVLAEVPGAWDVLEPVIRRGRKRGMYLTLGVQDDQRKTLDLDGKTHLLRNMVTADLYLEANGQRVAKFGKGRDQRSVPIPTLRNPDDLIIPAQPVYPMPARVSSEAVTAALGDTERLPTTDPMLAALLAAEPPKQDTATATITHDGLTINIDARATAEQPTKPLRRGKLNGVGPNVKRMALKLKRTHKTETVEEICTRLSHLKFDDVWAQLPSPKPNRNDAHRMWKAAGGGRRVGNNG